MRNPGRSAFAAGDRGEGVDPAAPLASGEPAVADEAEDSDDEYSGAYWTGTSMAVVEDLGPDQDQAIDEFRAYLQEHDET